MSRVEDRSNASDLAADPFYRFVQKTYGWHVAASYLALYILGGLPFVVWGGFFRQVWVYHVTWLVNSAAHVWGYQSWRTGDLSRNNWWVAIWVLSKFGLATAVKLPTEPQMEKLRWNRDR